MQVTKRRRSRKQLQFDEDTNAALEQTALSDSNSHPGSSTAKKPRLKSKTTAAADVSVASDATEGALSALGSSAEQQAAAVIAPKKAAGRKRPAATTATAVEAVNAAVAAVTADVEARKPPKRKRIKATEMAVEMETELVEPAEKGQCCFCNDFLGGFCTCRIYVCILYD